MRFKGTGSADCSNRVEGRFSGVNSRRRCYIYRRTNKGQQKMTSDPVPQKEVSEPPAEEGGRAGIIYWLRDCFLAGIVVTAPIAITVYLTWIVFHFFDYYITPMIPSQYNPNSYLPFFLPGVGLVVGVSFFILVGWFARNFLGRLIVRMSEGFLHRVPIIRVFYKAVKQIFETVMTSQSQAFREVVMLEFPRQGSWALGFVTGAVKGEVQRRTEDDVVNVFLPAALNPTSGFLLFVPRRDLISMSMTVEEAFKMIVSGGIIAPPDRGGSAKTSK